MSEPLVERAPTLARHDVDALAGGWHPDPFGVLGLHVVDGVAVVRVFAPGALAVEVVARDDDTPLGTLSPIEHSGVFEGVLVRVEPYALRIHWPDGSVQHTADAYSFGTLLSEFDLHLIAQGRHHQLSDALGASVVSIEGIVGTRFAVWAPNARRVSVVGDFNVWDGRRHPMRLRHAAGVWELFIPAVGPGERYKFELLGPDGALLPQKADPVARATELPPATGSVVSDPAPYVWTDALWMERRAGGNAAHEPLAIYELHVGSWLRSVNDPQCGWDTLGNQLIPYVLQLGFTHIELLPIMEHPFGGSWGYQPLGQFAPSARFGKPEEFARFVDRCHASGVGVILDWVPAHFPTDAHGLARFDGTALYEYPDPREGFHRDWNTCIFNFSRNEVRGFLIASALFWLERFHVDGLRVDAVASMLYRDYSRNAGEWIPNRYGGRENLEAIAFLRELNTVAAERCRGALVIAEESTAWPGVTAALAEGGLGFDFKWNMGWMHDTLRYMETEPIYRAWHHHEMTFGLIYAYSERFVLPLSHDEVVYGKKSLLQKMPGDRWQQFANLRAYFGFMWAHPGKKLLFMGDEIGQSAEWNHDAEIAWESLGDPLHAGVQRLVGDLNRLLRAEPALYAADALAAGFAWVIGDDRSNSVYAMLRQGSADAPEAAPVLIVSNFTPVPRHDYRIGVPLAGAWRERLNSDAAVYGGSNVGNAGEVLATGIAAHGHPYSVVLTLPPLATLFLSPVTPHGTTDV